jgi:hypothetical protein
MPIWSGASYVNHSADAATRREAAADAQHSLNELRRDLRDKGLTNDGEIDEAIAAWDRWGQDPDAIYLRSRCEWVARKSQVDSNSRALAIGRIVPLTR